MSKKTAKPPKVYEADLADDTAEDRRNANAGTERGFGMLEKSIAQLGAGRSIVVDREGRTIGGNKTREALLAAGMRRAVVVETDGSVPVVVKRTDLDLSEKNGRARKLAYFDNRVAQVDLSWDGEQMAADRADGFDFSDMFSEKEFDNLLAKEPGVGDERDPGEAGTAATIECPSCGCNFAPPKSKKGS